MNVLDLKQELEAVSLLIQARRETLNSQPTAVDQSKEEALVANLAKKVQMGLVCSLVEAQTLYQTLKASTLQDSFKEVLRNSIDHALANHNGNTMAVTVKPQKLTKLENYLTENDWKTIESMDASYISKCNCIAHRWKSLGIKSLNEQTVKNGVAILLCQMSKLPEASLIFQMVEDLKSTFHSLAMEYVDLLPYVKEFPDSPKKLPCELQKAAYQGSMPVQKHLEQKQAILKYIPLRSTSKLLGGKPQPNDGQPSAGSCGGAGMPKDSMVSLMMMKEMGNLFCSLRESLGLKGGSSSSSIGPTGPSAIKLSPSKQQQALQDFQPKARQAALPIADKSVATASQPKEATDLAPGPTGNGQHNDEQVGISAEDYELATFKALQERQQSKLPPKAAKKDTKNAAKKPKKQNSSSKGNNGGPSGSKPSAKGKPQRTLKRPAAAMAVSSQSHQGHGDGDQAVCQGYTIPPLQKTDLEVARNVYVSRHYSKARVYARNVLKMNEEDAKVYGRKFLRQSGAIWDTAKNMESQ